MSTRPCPDDRRHGCRPRLLDFGIAKLAHPQDLGARHDLTRIETIHCFLKRYTDMHRKQEANASIDEPVAAFERQLRQQMTFDEELADLAARQRETMPARRMLPVLPLGGSSADPSQLRS